MTNITVAKLSESDIEKMKIKSWPIWTKEPSVFDWFYDSEEHCYILEGEMLIKTAQGNVNIGCGDYVIFKKGLACTWEITKAVRKHYQFS